MGGGIGAPGRLGAAANAAPSRRRRSDRAGAVGETSVGESTRSSARSPPSCRSPCPRRPKAKLNGLPAISWPRPLRRPGRPTSRTSTSPRRERVRPRSCGVEHVGLWAVRKAGLDRRLEHLEVPGPRRSAARGSILGRRTRPGSERAPRAWRCRRRALGELREVDFEASSARSRYRASDALLHPRDAIEKPRLHRSTDRFGIEPTIPRYDRTNPFYEGRAARPPKARFGRSQERRSDGRLRTLGRVLDGSGFVQRSRVFEGHVSEGSTPETLLAGLRTPAGARGSWMPGPRRRAPSQGGATPGTAPSSSAAASALSMPPVRPPAGAVPVRRCSSAEVSTRPPARSSSPAVPRPGARRNRRSRVTTHPLLGSGWP